MTSNNTPLIIDNDKTKVYMLLFINVLFIVGAIWLVVSGYDGIFGTVLGWLGAILFSFTLVLQIRRYLKKEPLAKVDETGVHLSSYGFIPWSDITGYVEYKQMIQVYIANEDHYINKLPAPERMIANMNKKFGFSSVTIPTTCCSNEQKTELTNALKKRITLK
ncbi:MAG: STM3941 family protein [Candidatus Melainabacteria bacterium]|nr:STM3941 family protein [Candidatus Melainabacteria bacterium]